MKILPRTGENCPIKSECVHNMIFKFLLHKFLFIILINAHESITKN